MKELGQTHSQLGIYWFTLMVRSDSVPRELDFHLAFSSEHQIWKRELSFFANEFCSLVKVCESAYIPMGVCIKVLNSSGEGEQSSVPKSLLRFRFFREHLQKHLKLFIVSLSEWDFLSVYWEGGGVLQTRKFTDWICWRKQKDKREFKLYERIV